MNSNRIERVARKVAEGLKKRAISSGDDVFEEAARDALAEDGIDEDEHGPYLARIRELLPTTAPKGKTGKGPAGKKDGKSKKRSAADAGLFSAPFRFVALNESVAFAPEEIRSRGLDLPLASGFCGTLSYDLVAETPILIGAKSDDGTHDGPLKIGDDYAIPGATMRGLLRSACETIAYGRLFQVNRHHRYGVRDFEHPLFQDENRPVWDSLHAGWLMKRPPAEDEIAASDGRHLSEYVLRPCDKHMIRIRSLPPAHVTVSKPNDGHFHLAWLNKDLAERHRAVGQVVERSRPLEFDFQTKPNSFVIDPGRPDHVRPDPKGNLKGFYVFAGKSPTLRDIKAKDLDEQDLASKAGNQKKAEYVFVDPPGASDIRLTEDAFIRFELAHTKPSKNKRQPDGSYKVLHPTLASGRRIPVFFIGDAKIQDGDFSMGLTRFFKRGHSYSVGDVLSRETRHALGTSETFRPDIVEALFGHVYEPDEFRKDPKASVPPREISLKGRVAFGFATLRTPGKPLDPVSTVMMGPRASYAPFYLRGAHKDWTDDKARLAGRKRFFPRFPAAMASAAGRTDATAAVRKTLVDAKGNDRAEIQSHLALLGPRQAGDELVFSGTIKFHNVAAYEIGMILWAVTHGGDPAKPYRHMIGRAKTAGAGQVRVKSLRLSLVGNDAKADGELQQPKEWELPQGNAEGWTMLGGQSMAPFLRAFEKVMQAADAKWPRTPPVLEHLGAARPTLGAEIVANNRARYLALPEFGKLRGSVKLHRDGSEPSAPDRLLGAPSIAPSELKLPYT